LTWTLPHCFLEKPAFLIPLNKAVILVDHFTVYVVKRQNSEIHLLLASVAWLTVQMKSLYSSREGSAIQNLDCCCINLYCAKLRQNQSANINFVTEPESQLFKEMSQQHCFFPWCSQRGLACTAVPVTKNHVDVVTSQTSFLDFELWRSEFEGAHSLNNPVVFPKLGILHSMRR